MRDPKRLEPLYQQLKNVHEVYYPDWRFGQFIMNFLGWLQQALEPFFPEDDEMTEYIKQFSAGLDRPDTKLAKGKR